MASVQRRTLLAQFESAHCFRLVALFQIELILWRSKSFVSNWRTKKPARRRSASWHSPIEEAEVGLVVTFYASRLGISSS